MQGLTLFRTLQPNQPIEDTPARIDGLVGNTPLLDLSRLAHQMGVPENVSLLAKAEWYNPSGSIKDRPAYNIIRNAEENGLLKPGMTLLDSTSGNMGIALCFVGRRAGVYGQVGCTRQCQSGTNFHS